MSARGSWFALRTDRLIASGNRDMEAVSEIGPPWLVMSDLSKSPYIDVAWVDCGFTSLISSCLIAYSGSKTGRSPKDKRMMKDLASENDVWWEAVNVPMDEVTFRYQTFGSSEWLDGSAIHRSGDMRRPYRTARGK